MSSVALFRTGAVLFGVLCVTACTVAAVQPLQENASPRAAAPTSSIEWAQALQLLKSGRVAVVVQLHDLSVTLTTQEGEKFVTREPAIDAILAAIAMHAPNAGSIVVATE